VRARHRVLLLAGVVGIILLAVALMGTPGSWLAERNVDGALSHRDAAVGLVGLLVLGLMALGLDFQDWL